MDEEEDREESWKIQACPQFWEMEDLFEKLDERKEQIRAKFNRLEDFDELDGIERESLQKEEEEAKYMFLGMLSEANSVDVTKRGFELNIESFAKFLTFVLFDQE